MEGTRGGGAEGVVSGIGGCAQEGRQVQCLAFTGLVIRIWWFWLVIEGQKFHCLVFLACLGRYPDSSRNFAKAAMLSFVPSISDRGISLEMSSRMCRWSVYSKVGVHVSGMPCCTSSDGTNLI